MEIQEVKVLFLMLRNKEILRLKVIILKPKWKKFGLSSFVYIMLLVLGIGCKVPYYPPVKVEQTHYLVVEGYLNGSAPTVIRLTHARPVSQYDSARTIPELNAKVYIEDNHQNNFPVRETGNGVYTINTVPFDTAFKYRLHFFTSTGREYASDFVPFKLSPPIDSIDWSLKPTGIEIYANTHDDQNKTRYYRWTYAETWEFHAPQYSEFFFDGNKVVERTDSNQVHVCWDSTYPADIVLGSSLQLPQDLIYHNAVVLIPNHSVKLSVLYSIFITQYPLDSSGYAFWQAMQKNTEKIGSIFDPQPTQIIGNVHCITDTAEYVIGYISAGTWQQKRSFISNFSLPRTWNLPYGCMPVEIPPDKASLVFWTEANYFLGNRNLDGTYAGYCYDCANCSVRGASTKKPSFWP